MCPFLLLSVIGFGFVFAWHFVDFRTKMGSALNILGLVSKQESKTTKRRENQSETWQEREEWGWKISCDFENSRGVRQGVDFREQCRGNWTSLSTECGEQCTAIALIALFQHREHPVTKRPSTSTNWKTHHCFPKYRQKLSNRTTHRRH